MYKVVAQGRTFSRAESKYLLVVSVDDKQVLQPSNDMAPRSCPVIDQCRRQHCFGHPQILLLSRRFLMSWTSLDIVGGMLFEENYRSPEWSTKLLVLIPIEQLLRFPPPFYKLSTKLIGIFIDNKKNDVVLQWSPGVCHRLYSTGTWDLQVVEDRRRRKENSIYFSSSATGITINRRIQKVLWMG
ncbi:hypothetical protein CEXT_584761 [Caerostris extrusa]|uniref:Uncharacterized protein n=1 Tax=Caerostris extrusa TaxID=172846 RepID=A0AAV4T4Y8_CAEEX|nr:hypothetical protein CEXT_584761 [Caerostris extrusa]